MSTEMSTEKWTSPVYFDLAEVENITEEEKRVKLNYQKPVLLPAETELETNAMLTAHEPEPQPVAATTSTLMPNVLANNNNDTSIPIWTWLFLSLGALLVALLVADAYTLVVEKFAQSWFLGSLFGVLVLSITTAVLTLAWRAYQNLRSLRNTTALQREGQTLRDADSYGNALHYTNRIAQLYHHRSDIKPRLDLFYASLNDTHYDREICDLFSKQVLNDIDQQAYRVIVQRSKENALMVMVSPIALLDVVLTLWRNVRMIRDVATLYGGRPGFIGSLSLISAVIQNLIYADVSEMVADSVADAFGNSMLAVFSTQAAQGIGSGLLTARVGLKAMQACRPMPFLDEEKPKLKDIRWEVVTEVKSLFEKKEKKA